MGLQDFIETFAWKHLLSFRQLEYRNLQFGFDAPIQCTGLDDFLNHERCNGTAQNQLLTRQLRKKAIPDIFELGHKFVAVISHPLELIEHDRPGALLDDPVQLQQRFGPPARSAAVVTGQVPQLKHEMIELIARGPLLQRLEIQRRPALKSLLDQYALPD